MRIILAVVALSLTAGCLNREELSPTQKLVVEDYKEWIGENSHHVQDDLSPRLDKLFSVREIASQSMRSEYYQRTGARNEDKAGQAQIGAEIVDIFSDHFMWRFIEHGRPFMTRPGGASYEESKELYYNCENPSWAYRFGLAVNILSHENAHIVDKKAPHETVYKLGDACRDTAETMFYDQWREDCVNVEDR